MAGTSAPKPPSPASCTTILIFIVNLQIPLSRGPPANSSLSEALFHPSAPAFMSPPPRRLAPPRGTSARRAATPPLAPRGGTHAGGDSLVGLGRAAFRGEGFVAADALARHPGIEKERPPVDFDRHVRRQRQRVLDPALADVAPRAHHVGDDIDLKRFQAAHRECPRCVSAPKSKPNGLQDKCAGGMSRTT